MSFRVHEFASLRIFSNDLKKCRDWYKVFFNQNPIEDLEFFVSFKISGVCFDITVPDTKNPHSTVGSVGYWLVDDVEAVLKHAEKLGGRLYRGPLKVEETGRTILQIQDPFGNILGFESKFK